MEQPWMSVNGMAVRQPGGEEKERHRLSGKDDS